MSEIRMWTARETVGFGIPNPTVSGIPVTEEMLERLRPEAEAEGLTPFEYLKREAARFDEEGDDGDA